MYIVVVLFVYKPAGITISTQTQGMTLTRRRNRQICHNTPENLNFTKHKGQTLSSDIAMLGGGGEVRNCAIVHVNDQMKAE